jgi:hypothetical protein
VLIGGWVGVCGFRLDGLGDWGPFTQHTSITVELH